MATRNILSHFRLEVAAAKRKCDASSKHEISMGETHFAYEKVPRQRKNICMACTPEILRVAQEHLADLIKKLP